MRPLGHCSLCQKHYYYTTNKHKKGFDCCQLFKDIFYFKGLAQLCIKNSLLLKEKNPTLLVQFFLQHQL